MLNKLVRWFFRLLGAVFLLLLLLAAIVLLTNVNARQPLDVVQGMPVYQKMEGVFTVADVDSLKALYGNNKQLPQGYELQALLALSYYPELKNVTISFELVPDGAPMESNFNFATLLGPAKNRHYRILLNNGQEAMLDPILLRNLPFDAQVGILAHELGHTVYYHQLSLFGIGKWGLMYALYDDFRATHERSTDLVPVVRGAGWQIHHYAAYVRTGPGMEKFYQEASQFIDKYYMTHHEIMAKMVTTGLYPTATN